MRKYRAIPLFVMSTSAIISSIGYGSWIFNQFQEIEKEISTKNSQPVCYIQGNKSVKYTTIEKALAVAGDKDHIDSPETIVVIPGTNPVISSSCTLDTKDTLLIPYEDETYMRDLSKITDKNVSSVTSVNFSDNDSTSVSNNRKNEVTIRSSKVGTKVVFENKGTIKVGGELGVGIGNQRPSGHTNGKYCQISIENSASIDNYGEIDLYGYIKKKSINNAGIITNYSSGKMVMPFVIHDYSGGGFSASANQEKILPFNIFEIPNCQTTSIYQAGSKLDVMLAIYASNKMHVPENSRLIGAGDGLFNISSGSVAIDYYSYDFPFTKIDSSKNQPKENISKMKIGINGAVSLTSMKLSLGGMSISTGDFIAPLSYKFDVTCNSGSILKLNKKTKFLKGSSLQIIEGGTAEINDQSLFYQSYSYDCNYVGDLYPSALNPASLINNGKLTLNAPFGGFIETNGSSGELITTANYNSEASSKEMVSLKKTSKIKYEYTYKTMTVKGSAMIKANQLDTAEKSLIKENEKYVAHESSWIGNASGQISEIESKTAEKNGSYTTCFDSSTDIETNKGNVNIANINTGDLILSYNHYSGKFEYKPIAAVINHGLKVYQVIEMFFNDGSHIGFISSHGLFDVDENKYVDINPKNYKNYIGHQFLSYKANKFKIVVLSRAEIVEKRTSCYTLVSSENLNCIGNGLLNITSVLKGIYNIFDYDRNHNFDRCQMKSDIERFGLYEYSDFKDLISKKIFVDYGFKYFKVSIGKGLMNYDTLLFYIRWLKNCINNGEAIIY